MNEFLGMFNVHDLPEITSSRVVKDVLIHYWDINYNLVVSSYLPNGSMTRPSLPK